MLTKLNMVNISLIAVLVIAAVAVHAGGADIGAVAAQPQLFATP
ncbi:MAG: hypothetical protein QNJ09_15270 [Paracoccaceae bacterium]|nr:hypothetical protein [Paracoccaceae bacterium]